ncbi:MAG: hypothetical protein NVS1B11_14080 [Terriglobales bacterium]
MSLPQELRGKNYISFMTYRKTGVPVPTPVWFGEDDDKLYVMTGADSGKTKRIRNNPEVRIAPCTMRGKITGPQFTAKARILPETDWPRAKQSIESKYWLARLTPRSKTNVYIAIQDIRSVA